MLTHIAILLSSLSGCVLQDPFAVAPNAYKLQFENDWVRVVRVHYGPHEKIASHDHPKTGTVYVYLSNSGPVRFRHTGDEKFTVVRPAVKAGGFRLGRAATETHEVESLSDSPTDFLRVELKTEAVDTQSFRGRFPPEGRRANKSSQKVRFENGQVRITRITCAARSVCGDARAIQWPAVSVSVTESRVKEITDNGSSADSEMKPGQTKWIESGGRLKLQNTVDKPAEFLLIELKTKPLKN